MTQFIHIYPVSIPIINISFIGWYERDEDGNPAACIYLKDSSNFFYVLKDSEDFKRLCAVLNHYPVKIFEE